MQLALQIWRYWMQLAQPPPQIWRHWMQLTSPEKILKTKYGGTECSIEAQDGKYEDTGCNLNPKNT